MSIASSVDNIFIMLTQCFIIIFEFLNFLAVSFFILDVAGVIWHLFSLNIFYYYWRLPIKVMSKMLY